LKNLVVSSVGGKFGDAVLVVWFFFGVSENFLVWWQSGPQQSWALEGGWLLPLLDYQI